MHTHVTRRKEKIFSMSAEEKKKKYLDSKYRIRRVTRTGK